MLNVERSMWKVFCAAGVLMLSLNAPAIDFVQTNRFVVAETNTLAHETWVSAQTVQVNGSTSNDLFATAPEMELNGTFYGDVWGMGDGITATGIFRNSARLLSRTVQVQGTHYGPVIAAGNTVKIDRTAMLYNDLFGLGENIILEGSVSGDVRVLAQRVTLGGQFKKDVFVAAQEIVVLPGTIINGSLTYSAPDELVLPSSVVLNGELARTLRPAVHPRLLKENLGTHFMFALAALVTGLAFSSLFPSYTATAMQGMRETRGFCLLAGFAGLVVLPMTSFFIFLTLVGIPLSILILLLYLILLYLSKIIVALWIGSAILRKDAFNKRNTVAPLALGLLVIYALTSIAAAEMLINIAITILGLGALLIALFKKPVLVIQTGEIPKNQVNQL